MTPITKRTISILKNFAKIHNSLLVEPGNVIRIMDDIDDAIFARAELDCKFPCEFAIGDLSDFLRVLSLFSEPQIECKPEYLIVSEGHDDKGKKKVITHSSKSKFLCDEKSAIVFPQEDRLDMPSIDFQFKMTTEDFEALFKACLSLRLDVLEFESVDGKMNVTAVANKAVSRHAYTRTVGESSKRFKGRVFKNNFHIMPGNYIVELSAEGIAHFLGSGLEYWLAMDITKG